MGRAADPPRRSRTLLGRPRVDGIHSYSYVKKLTEKIVADALAAIDRAEEPRQMELKLTQEHPLIRPADIYAELFSRCAATQPSLPLTHGGTEHDHH